MSVSGISSSSLFNTQGAQNTLQQFRDFLASTCSRGNLSAVQSDFATLQNLEAQNSTTASQSRSPLALAFRQRAKDLHSENLSAAQQDFSTIQQAGEECYLVKTPSPSRNP
jgi:hypothetical protein